MKTKIFMTAFVVSFSFSICNAQLPYLVKDINPGKNGSVVNGLTVAHETVYFIANDGINGQQIWKSNGTPATTSILKQIAAKNVGQLKAVNEMLFFVSANTNHEVTLWKSDGTEVGTIPLRIFPNTDAARIEHEKNGKVLIRMRTLLSTYEWWQSDGTESGTVRLPSELRNPLIRSLQDDGSLFFYEDSRALWKGDGTISGSVKLVSLPGASYWDNGLNYLANVKNKILFAHSVYKENDPTYTRYIQLWSTDGTRFGTKIIGKFNKVYEVVGNYPGQSSNDEIYIIAEDSTGTVIWKSDGTAEGTMEISKTQTMLNRQTAKTKWYFISYDENGIASLWQCDKNGTNSMKITSPYPNYPGVTVPELFTVDDTAYIYLWRNNEGELWQSNGTKDGTFRIDTGGLNASGFQYNSGNIYFVNLNPATGQELWSLKVNDNSPSIINDNCLIKISPNPFNGSATVNINADVSNGAEFVLYDVLGKEVRRFTVTMPTFTIERGELSDGVYTLQWLNGNNTISQRVVILR